MPTKLRLLWFKSGKVCFPSPIIKLPLGILENELGFTMY